MEIKKSQRKRAKMNLLLNGPAGAGKTYSALLIAFGITQNWNKVCVIDTECHSSELYSHLGGYNVLSLTAPFSPERYIEAIQTCENAGMEVIIVDSLSHEWEGSGGILDNHSNMTGNSFTSWGKLTPRHNAFVQKILQSPVHIIATARSKQNYVLTEKNNKMIPEKIGLKAITREGINYEFTLVLDIDIKHNAISSKDRTELFSGKPCFKISQETGKLIMDWCNKGISSREVIDLISKAQNVDILKKIHAGYPEFRSEIQECILKRKEAIESNIQVAI